PLLLPTFPTRRSSDLGSIHLTTAYGIRGAFNHNWSPNWSSSLFGGRGWVRYDDTARAEYCAVYALAAPGQGRTYSCNPNYSISRSEEHTSELQSRFDI